MARPEGAVGKHRHRVEVIFARHEADPLDELLALAKDKSLPVERRIKLWQSLMPYIYPKLRCITVEHATITAEDILALPPEIIAEAGALSRKYLAEEKKTVRPRDRSGEKWPLPTGPEDRWRYEDAE
jgi:hypothetical protein